MSMRSLLVFCISALHISLASCASVSSTPAQTFLGVGGSGAWWPYDLHQFPEAVRQNISDLLFTQNGLGLSSYRFNAGGGGVGVGNPVRAPQTFYVSAGQYDWNRDPQGVYFLTQASRRGVSSLTMFANSAPAPLTAAKTSCNSNFVTGTGAAYGTYLADIVSHFKDQGINFKYVSPMNEPDSSFGPTPCGQEGMVVAPTQRAEVVNGLYNALNSKGLASSVGIIADESSNLDRAQSQYASWLPQVINRVAALVHHTYDFPTDDRYRTYVNTVRSAYPNKAIWMSEVCCSLGNADGSGRGWSQGYDPTIKNALMFSTMVFQSFNVAGEPQYDWWTLVSNALGCNPQNNPSCATAANSNGWNDGLIYYDSNYKSNGNYNLYLKKQFWTYKHFGNFVKPGSQRRAISGSDAPQYSMAVSSSTQYFIIALNSGTASTSFPLTFPENVCGTTGYRTSATENFATIAAATGSGTSWRLTLGATSLTTYVFRKGAC